MSLMSPAASRTHVCVRGPVHVNPCSWLPVGQSLFTSSKAPRTWATWKGKGREGRSGWAGEAGGL